VKLSPGLGTQSDVIGKPHLKRGCGKPCPPDPSGGGALPKEEDKDGAGGW